MKRLAGISGFTLIEGMVATAILSVGVLAVGSMQAMSMRRNADATELSQAVNLASDMLERIQFNRRNVTAYAGIDTTAACTQSPITQPMALGDCQQWQALLNNLTATGASQANGLRGAAGAGVVRGQVVVNPIVTVPPLNQNSVRVIVTWSGLSMGNAGGATRRVVLDKTIAPE